jgi:AAA+ ATPase superfamily predicted ATPase
MFIEPVFGKKFFGREEVLGTLQKRVTALKGGYRQNLALTGPMLSGKSSILRHFLKNIKDPDILPLYVEMTEEDFTVFARRFMATLLYAYLASRGKILPDIPGGGNDLLVRGMDGAENDFDRLCFACDELIPETARCVEKIRRSIKQKKHDMAYEGLLALTSVFKTETGKSCIVILDEFHNLSSFHLKKPFRTFGKFIMVQKNTMYVVSSSQQTLLRDILSKKLSLLFGNFEVIEINGFDNQTARSFLSDKLRDIDPDGIVKDYLVQLCQGNPFYLEVIAGALSRLVSRAGDGRPAKEHLLGALAELLYDSAGVLNQYFTNNISFFLEKKNRKKYIPLLVSLASGNGTMKEIQKDMGRSDRDLGTKLRKLVEMDLVWNSGVFYRVSDKLFEYWIKHVYSVKTRSMIDDMDIKYIEFKSSMDADFADYCSFRGLDAIDVISDILCRFKGEKVRLGLTSHKLSPIGSIKSEALSPTVTRLTGSASSGKWLFHVKENDIADENDISALFAVKDVDGDGRISRKIFIPLKGIEQNAFLLAKEHNIWVWDIDKINKILRLYGRFELVL